MKLIYSLIFTAVLILITGYRVPVYAADNINAALIGAEDNLPYAGLPTISLSVKDMRLKNFVQMMASLSKTKIELDEEYAHSKITCSYEEAEFADVMHYIAKYFRADVYWQEGDTRLFIIKPQKKIADKK